MGDFQMEFGSNEVKRLRDDAVERQQDGNAGFGLGTYFPAGFGRFRGHPPYSGVMVLFTMAYSDPDGKPPPEKFKVVTATQRFTSPVQLQQFAPSGAPLNPLSVAQASYMDLLGNYHGELAGKALDKVWPAAARKAFIKETREWCGDTVSVFINVDDAGVEQLYLVAEVARGVPRAEGDGFGPGFLAYVRENGLTDDMLRRPFTMPDEDKDGRSMFINPSSPISVKFYIHQYQAEVIAALETSRSRWRVENDLRAFHPDELHPDLHPSLKERNQAMLDADRATERELQEEADEE